MKASQLVFGEFRLDPIDRALWKGANRVSITPKSFEVLEHLALNAGRLVTKEELLRVVWSDCHVGEAVVKTVIGQVRVALGDTADASQSVETVSRLGYRFIASVRASNLPIMLTSFVGRQSQLVDLERHFTLGRLLTLAGPAGVGKSRLAARLAENLLPLMPHGVCWVDLAPVSDASSVAHVTACALEAREHSDNFPTETVAHVIHRRQLLLVFDNCEHLVNECAALADRLLRECPNLKILATSREPLGVAGERVYQVPFLTVPEASVDSARVLGYEAVQLFVERAQHANNQFAICERNATAIAHISRRLDGLPLAIELAAARTTALSPQQIAARLDNMFELLVSRNRNEPPRHQTLRAAIAWSYDLLLPKERLLLACLSVFAGSFTLAAAEAVCGDIDGLDADEVLPLLTQLTDRSLVTVVTGPPADEMRYRLLTIVHHYVREQLPPDLKTPLARRHAEFYLGVAQEVDTELGSIGTACFARLRREDDNVRAALQWGHDEASGHETALHLAGLLWVYWLCLGEWSQLERWLEEMLQRTGGTARPARAQALCGLGAICQGDLERAHQLEAGVALWRTLGNSIQLGRWLSWLGLVITTLGQLQRAEDLIEEGIDLLRPAGSPWHLAVALGHLAQVRCLQGRLPEAASIYDESITTLRAISDPWTLGHHLERRAAIATTRGQHRLAEEDLRESLLVLQPATERWIVSRSLVGLADAACFRQDYVRAARLLGAAEALGKTSEVNSTGQSIDCTNQLRAALGSDTLSAMMAEGRKLSHDEAIALALAPMEIVKA